MKVFMSVQAQTAIKKGDSEEPPKPECFFLTDAVLRAAVLAESGWRGWWRCPR